MRGIALLPLDDRPVNLDAPRLLAEVAGETLRTPPASLMGRFLVPGDADGLARWLIEDAANCRALIISLDMLAYGGLVASRTPAVAAREAARRLEALREIKRRNPAVKIFAFNVIMRLTITASDAQTRAAGRDIFRYCVLRDRAERLGEADARAELAEVEARIPAGILSAYLAARTRNHAVNRAALELLADGVIDDLALVQEDTAPTGLHIAEQQALAQWASAHAPAGTWRIYAGTDEAGQTLLARCVASEMGLRIPIQTIFRDPVAAESPALFEDTPLRETVRRHVEAVGGAPGTGGISLAVQTFTPPQPDLFEMPALKNPSWGAALAHFTRGNTAEWVNSLPREALAAADVAYCNGGDPHLIDTLCSRGMFGDLYSYAGWNTAGNSIGTTLAHAVLRQIGIERGENDAHSRAQLTALLDDVFYQTIVRASAIQRAEEFGVSPLNLGDKAAEMEAWIDNSMHALWKEARNCYPSLARLERPFRVTLPWGRLFEARIEFPALERQS